MTVGRVWLMLLVGCGGTVAPDPATPGNSTSWACPSIGTQLGKCADFHVLRAALSCGGDGKMTVATSTAPGGANRFTVQLMNGSRFQGTLINNDPPCNIQNGTDIDFTFGVVYTADQGVETADGSMSPCIVQSKTVYSSFNFDMVGNFVHEGYFKEQLHQVFDTQVINQIYGTASKPLVGRCQRWREMP